MQASAAPDYFGDSNFTNPEEGLVAALASCQMLTFLSIAALKGFIVDTYEDQPEGVLGKNERGNIMVVEVTLRPKVVFAGNRRPDANDVEHMHLAAHDKCFIANSLLTRVVMAPR